MADISKETDSRNFTVDISAISIPPKKMRARETMGDVQGIALSIQARSQQYPIIVQDIGNGRYELVDGLHRIEACKLLGRTTILAKLTSEMTPFERLKMDIELNRLHNAFSWQDTCKHEEKLHRAAIENYGSASRGLGALSSANGWGLRDTANIFGVSEAKISQDLKLARAFEEYPHLAQLPSRAEALRQLQRIQEGLEVPTEKLVELRTRLLESYVHGDFFAPEIQNSIDPRSVDLVLTNLADMNRLPEFMTAVKTMLSPTGSCVFFHTELNALPLMSRFEDSNWIVLKPFSMFVFKDDMHGTMMPFFWCTPNITLHPGHVRLPSPLMATQRLPSSSRFPPVPALVKIIQAIPQSPKFILDPFGYGGNTVIAARTAGVNCRVYCAIKSTHDEGMKKLTKHFIPSTSPALKRMTQEGGEA